MESTNSGSERIVVIIFKTYPPFYSVHGSGFITFGKIGGGNSLSKKRYILNRPEAILKTRIKGIRNGN